MPKIYKRHCNTCGKYYESKGKKYCSQECVPYEIICEKPKLSDGTFYPSIPSICECDEHCNTIVYGGKKFISGHNAKTKDGRRILCNAHKGRPSPMKGKPSSLKGRKHDHLPSEKTRKLWSLQRKGKPAPKNCFQKGMISWNKDIPCSEETKNKISKSMIGKLAKEKHPLWKGGSSFLPYCPKFDTKFKEAVRFRDNHICQLCGIKQSELVGHFKKLDVHHIHGDKANCYPDCIALCHPCNIRVESKKKKKFYEDLFMNMLNDRKLLFWSRRRKKV